jgi:RND family efflux transporter MFP subunit
MVRPISTGGLLLALSFSLTPAIALTLNGVTAFGEAVTLNAATDGSIKSVAVQPGQQVAAGQVLIEIDAARQRAQLEKTEALVHALQPDVTIAALELERAQELYSLESLSQVDLQNAENKLARAEGHSKAAQAERDIAADDLSRTEIKAPFAATVDRIHVSVAQYVNPSVEVAPLISLVGLRGMKAVGLLEAAQWKANLSGKQAKVRVGGKIFNGKVLHLSRSPQKNSGENPRFELHVMFTADSPLAEGLPVTIDIKD